MVIQKRTDTHFQEMTENDNSAPYAVQGDREINRRTPTLNTLFTDAILRKIINATKKNFVKFYISAIYNQTLAALFWHTCAKNHEMCATKRPVLHLLSLVVYLFSDATHLHY